MLDYRRNIGFVNTVWPHGARAFFVHRSDSQPFFHRPVVLGHVAGRAENLKVIRGIGTASAERQNVIAVECVQHVDLAVRRGAPITLLLQQHLDILGGKTTDSRLAHRLLSRPIGFGFVRIGPQHFQCFCPYRLTIALVPGAFVRLVPFVVVFRPSFGGGIFSRFERGIGLILLVMLLQRQFTLALRRLFRIFLLVAPIDGPYLLGIVLCPLNTLRPELLRVRSTVGEIAQPHTLAAAVRFDPPLRDVSGGIARNAGEIAFQPERAGFLPGHEYG